MSAGNSKKREHHRVEIKLVARVKFDNVDDFVECFAPNISKGGVFLQTQKPHPKGTKLQFKIQLKDGNTVLQGKGVVIWSRAASPDSTLSKASGMGVKFLTLDPKSKALVERILQTKAIDPDSTQPSSGLASQPAALAQTALPDPLVPDSPLTSQLPAVLQDSPKADGAITDHLPNHPTPNISSEDEFPSAGKPVQDSCTPPKSPNLGKTGVLGWTLGWKADPKRALVLVGILVGLGVIIFWIIQLFRQPPAKPLAPSLDLMSTPQPTAATDMPPEPKPIASQHPIKPKALEDEDPLVLIPSLSKKDPIKPTPTTKPNPHKKQSKSGFGKLLVNTTPWTEVYLGNRKLGATPLGPIRIKNGKQKLRLVNRPHKIDETLTVTIKPGDTTRVIKKLN